MNNIYDNPEKFGLSIVRSIDTAGSYEFDILLVLEDSTGNLFWVTDSGCSCPTPFEGVGISDLHELTVDTYASFQEMLWEWEEQGSNALNPADRVDIEKIVVRKLMPKLANVLDHKDIIVDEDDEEAPPITRPWIDVSEHSGNEVHFMGEHETLTVETPHAKIHISTLVGTGVSIYEDDGSPVAMIFLKDPDA